MEFIKKKMPEMKHSYGIDENKNPNTLQTSNSRGLREVLKKIPTTAPKQFYVDPRIISKYANRKQNDLNLSNDYQKQANTQNALDESSWIDSIDLQLIKKLEDSLPPLEELCNTTCQLPKTTFSATRKFYEEFKYEIQDLVEEEAVTKPAQSVKEKPKSPKIPRCRTRIVESKRFKILTLREYNLQKEKQQAQRAKLNNENGSV
ncbi:uncharacterized protein LOC132796230 isoform X1 [Drosophila nasuta]|uniref:uncharacterized protein LOC132796230 isoform X1 n=1 Tax=Drosophila nasuta TaxID=42062 RepID=UPI00295E6439|nr:uncharacterized protein LOC132796230 isoform X1 [Drosophila nasuta]XP_060663297.1 uncharacterized protein LOC132796230 isoform X1 [Drosophila nasuta]